VASRVVFRQRPRSTFLLLYGVDVVSIALLVAVHPHDLVPVLIVGAGMTVILTAVGLYAGHQRLIIDGERIWVRIVRWRGPIALADVVGVYAVPIRTVGQCELVLVQPTAGPRVGPRSTFMTLGTVRGQHTGMRYVTLSPWMLTGPVLGLLAPPLLRNPATAINQRARALFR
jgi:hypothetical protein